MEEGNTCMLILQMTCLKNGWLGSRKVVIFVEVHVMATQARPVTISFSSSVLLINVGRTTCFSLTWVNNPSTSHRACCPTPSDVRQPSHITTGLIPAWFLVQWSFQTRFLQSPTPLRDIAGSLTRFPFVALDSDPTGDPRLTVFARYSRGSSCSLCSWWTSIALTTAQDKRLYSAVS